MKSPQKIMGDKSILLACEILRLNAPSNKLAALRSRGVFVVIAICLFVLYVE